MWHASPTGITRTRLDDGRNVVVRPVLPGAYMVKVIVDGDSRVFPFAFHCADDAMKAVEAKYGLNEGREAG
jgi:hypothetical protein